MFSVSPPLPHAKETPVSSMLTAQLMAGTSKGARSLPGASSKPQAEGELMQWVGEVLEHRSRSSIPPLTHPAV